MINTKFVDSSNKNTEKFQPASASRVDMILSPNILS